jgi:hypothetical protein
MNLIFGKRLILPHLSLRNLWFDIKVWLTKFKKRGKTLCVIDICHVDL